MAPRSPGLYAPGSRVTLPSHPEWGIGSVQSVDGHRVTVNFEHAGKRLLLSDQVEIDLVNEE